MNHLSNIPIELTQFIAGFLPVKDLAAFSATCKEYKNLVERIDLPASNLLKIMKPKLDIKVVQKNALTLWTYSFEALNVTKKGRIVVVHSRSKTSEKEKIREAKVRESIKTTLREIFRLNYKNPAGQRLYVWNPNWSYSDCYPADYLAKKIAGHFEKDEQILEAAKLVEEQRGLYPEYIHNSPLREDKRVLEFNIIPTEAFFLRAHGQ